MFGKKKDEVAFERLEFPEVTDVSIAFGGYPRDWFDAALKKAEGIEPEWENKANELFFNGGKIDINKSLPEDYRAKGFRMLQAVLGSWEPKHEHKAAVCGLILKSICKR